MKMQKSIKREKERSKSKSKSTDRELKNKDLGLKHQGINHNEYFDLGMEATRNKMLMKVPDEATHFHHKSMPILHNYSKPTSVRKNAEECGFVTFNQITPRDENFEKPKWNQPST